MKSKKEELLKFEQFGLNERGVSHWVKSLAIHSIIFMVGITVSIQYHEVPLAKKVRFSVLESSVRVDVVAMPKLTIKERRTLQKEIQSLPELQKEEVKAPDQKPKMITKAKIPEDPYQKVLFKAKKMKKKRDFHSLLKEIGKRKTRTYREKSLKAEGKGRSRSLKGSRIKGELKKLIVAGNRLSKGVGLIGDTKTMNPELFEEYALNARDKVKENWKLPSYLLDKGYKCIIQVFISRNGDLMKSSIHQSSGNRDFDRGALMAIGASAPFTVVPEEIINDLSQGKLYLVFPL